MNFIKTTFPSAYDGLMLEATLFIPKEKPKGIIQIAHGMAEHKERYFDFMKFLCEHRYLCIIHDHRGHGKSIQEDSDFGYFYTDQIDGIVQDLYQITKYVKHEYPNLPVFLFAHSMGTLVARNYMKQYDKEVEKVILCGIPTQNILVPLALLLTKASIMVCGGKHRNKLLNFLSFHPYNHGYTLKNAWLSSDENVVKQYNENTNCGFIFTNNGFLNLFQMLKRAYEKKDWKVQHPALPILLIAGENDPVIQNKKKFYETEQFLREVGYTFISSKLYSGKRHELLNEKNKIEVYQDILNFLRNENSSL